jgi:PAS domain S-box-containing protein
MPQPESLGDDCLAGGGEMGALMRSLDWAKTPIGPVATWSPALRTIIRLLLVNRFQLFLWWGPHYVQFYNDASRPILGAKHPRSMGQPAADCWSEIWHVIGPLIDSPFRGGAATWMEDIFLEINRYGAPEETHFTIAYSPVPDETVPSGIGGVFATVHEITGKVVGERRVVVLRDLGTRASEAKTDKEACATAAKTLAAHDKDIPFALIYLLNAEGKHAELAAASGVARGESISPLVVRLEAEGRSGWPLAEVVEANSARVVSDLAARFGSVPLGPWSDLPTTAVVLPIPSTRAHLPAGLLVAGASARLRLDEQYRGFLELVAGQIGNAVANARAYEEEKKRAEALAELDRAKTAFFSNVSHEFRTPLTLMLGPVEDALADTAESLPAKQRERLETAHRSSLRLLKLVNTLLDFARIEAGRVQAVYEPTDLAALTAELASNFRSACEKAGLRLVVDCPPLLQPVWVDRDMWEKVVLNLLSNAFKFTFEGQIAVRLRAAGDAVGLSVHDTGTGIPAAELPRIFERFHRVEGAHGRTHEGTGIGLALVQELVKLHGGDVGVESIYGQGSTFTVSVPSGTAHLPADRIGAASTLGSTAVGAKAFIEEALRWVGNDEMSRSFPGSVGNAREAFPPEGAASRRPTGTPEEEGDAGPRPRILWADDNADMRDYVRRLLAPQYDVEAVPDGEAALAAARAHSPDLVLSDVMMPRLDGFGLLAALRADPRTSTTPVILLSARAGEESRVEGLQAGADDYLIKPFSARELLARVGARLEITRARRESERRVTQVLESITEAFQVFDAGWRITYMNPVARKTFAARGIDPDAMIGKHFWDELFPEARDAEAAAYMRRAMTERVPVSFESYYAPWDMWQSCRFDPLPDGGLANYFRDITDQKRAEADLRESEERFRRFFELGLIGMAITSPSKGCIEINDEICEILGYQRDELLSKTWAELTHPDDVAADLAQFNRVMAGEIDGYTMRKRWVSKDGRVIHSVISVNCVRLADRSVDYFVALLQDVTERQRAEEVLRASEERFRGTFENAAVGIAHVDAKCRFLRVNETLCVMLGYTRDELLRLTCLDITYPDDVPANRAQIMSLFSGDLPSYKLEKRHLRKDGATIWIDMSVSLQRDEAGRPAYAIEIIEDISDRKRLDAELRQAKELAEAANRAKDEFLANVSHEIRTPFGAILGLTELVLDTPLTEDQRRCLATVKSAADHLLGVVNDLLDFSKIEAGKLELAPADFPLRSTFRDTLRALAVRAHSKGLELVCHVQSDVPDALVGDAGRLRQVLLNLIGNAIKFTEQGEVVMRVEVAGDPASEGEVGLHFKVRDTGIGIPPDKQERIFRAFEQEDSSTTRKFGGTGLGLTIAARLVALMGGKITVDSEPGRGSTFTFTARFGRGLHPSEPTAVGPPVLLHDLPVLIVDDNATNRHILEEWLRGWRMKPAAVGDGLTALDALWHGAACGLRYALVLLDAHMPDTDGLALAAKIRQRAELSVTRIILLTSEDRPGDQARIRELHIDAHLLKPVSQDELLETIYRVMSQADGDTKPAREQTTAPAVTPLRILVAEDNEFNTRHLERLLVRQGNRVRLANNGRTALALAQATAFDLLLLDLHMPELDGFQVARAIRERERVAAGHLPIIALTARSRKEDREQCLAAGMDDFLLKPVRATELFAAVDRVVSRHGASRPAQPHTGEGTSLLDAAVLLAACGGDEEVLRELCQDFQTYAPARLTEVGDALRDQDAPRLREAAHKLRGLLSAFSTIAGNIASDLEDQAARGQLDAARQLVGRLETMARDLIQLVGGLSLETLQNH